MTLGLLAVATALLVNHWSVARTLSPDGLIESRTTAALIVAFQLAIGAVGLWWLRHPPLRSLPKVRGALVGGLSVVMVGGLYGSVQQLAAMGPERTFRAAWNEMIASEDVILELTPQLGKLSTSVLNLQLPSRHAASVFADRVSIVDLDSSPVPVGGSLGDLTVDVRHWPAAPKTESTLGAEVALWSQMLDTVHYFTFAKFYVIDGDFVDDRRDQYEANVGFQALARLRTGALAWLRSTQRIVWKDWTTAGLDGAAGERAPDWRVHEWASGELHSTTIDRPLFAEVLDEAADVEDVARARRSRHEELVLEFLLDREQFVPPHPYFSLESFDRHPGVAVVDLDRDGFDDFYVTERWGKNMLFRNRGNGTFDEIAEQVGLDLDGGTNAVLFADLDNDGDADAFLAKGLERSVYLVNDDGVFVDRTDELVEGVLPYFGSSVSGVDYDNDGLLDIYVSTYAAKMSDEEPGDVFDDYLPDNEAQQLKELRRSHHAMLARAGPPNVMLRNLGDGRFAVVDIPELKLYRNSYQSTWADIDDDGDADVYIANDFSPNFMVRNDGDGRFVDVTTDTRTSDIGFGMGSSFGDYDGDGRQDLYVTNMYSKAGLRITNRLGTIDPRFGEMARGNSLFRNTGQGFEKVSGLEAPALLVENAGWSWGSQFGDVDNDGDLDIAALNGYYTAPDEVAQDVDI